jgi:subtilase family serine protease
MGMSDLARKARAAFCVGVLLVLLSATLPVVTVAGKGLEPFQLFLGEGGGEPVSVSGLGVPPFTPQQVWKAYDFTPLLSAGYDGAGQTIAIVDAYGSRSITADVATFSSKFNLSACSLNVYYPDGMPFYRDPSWAIETSLDVEWAHAMAPQATVALVVAYDSSFQRMYNAIEYAINNVPDVTVLSMSFGSPESSYPTSGAYTISTFNKVFQAAVNKGISCFASSGDNSATAANSITYPASDPNVTAVGGTSLHVASDGSYISETAWSKSSGGASRVFNKPSYQTTGSDDERGTADVAYDADPQTGFQVYSSRHWYPMGGTSAGAPQWAALFAIASQYHKHTYGDANPQLYSIPASAYHDVTTGSNGYYSASSGWDYPTGWGTPDAYEVVIHLT